MPVPRPAAKVGRGLGAAVLAGVAVIAVAAPVDLRGWPDDCGEILRAEAGEPAALVYSVTLNRQAAGTETVCVWQAGERATATVATDMAFAKNWLVRVAVKHCRREVWRWPAAGVPRLFEMTARTDFDISGGLFNLFQPDTALTARFDPALGRYAFGDAGGQRKMTVDANATIRSPWTEAMVRYGRLMDPQRFAAPAIEVAAAGGGFVDGVATRRYRVTTADYRAGHKGLDWELRYRAADGRLIGLTGEVDGIPIEMARIDGAAGRCRK